MKKAVEAISGILLFLWEVLAGIFLIITIFVLFLFYSVYDIIFKTNYSEGFLPPKGR